VANAHRPHVLFAGTKLLSHAPGKNSSFEQTTPAAGDACVCVVLRTGWASTRGELVRLATRGQEDRGGVAVRAESTKLLAFLLCVGAATAVAVLVQPAAAVPLTAGAAASSAAEAPAAAAAVTSLAAVAALEFKALANRLLRASRVLTSVVPTDLDGASSLAFGRLANVLQKTCVFAVILSQPRAVYSVKCSTLATAAAYFNRIAPF
jgi:magnesium-transporting ATPase (P-type)